MLTFSTRNTRYVKVPVRGRIAGADVDLTGDVVTLAWIPSGTVVADGDFEAGDWETATDAGSGRVTYYARRLAAELPPGRYTVYVHVEHGAEVIEDRAGPMTVTA